MKIIHILHLHYHPKSTEQILKNKQKAMCVFIRLQYTINHGEMITIFNNGKMLHSSKLHTSDIKYKYTKST